METQLGFTPVQLKHHFKFEPEDVRDYFRDVSCDYERFCFSTYIGHYQNMWGHESYDINDRSSIGDVLTSSGMTKLDEFLDKKYSFPIKIVWEYIIRTKGESQKVIVSLTEEMGQAFMLVDVKENTSEKVPLAEFANYYRRNRKGNGIMSNFSKEMMKELVVVCSHLGYDFEEVHNMRINREVKNWTTRDHFRQIQLSDDKKSVSVFIWDKWGNADFIENRIPLPMNSEVFQEHTDNHYISYMYQDVKVFLNSLMHEKEWYEPKIEKIRSIEKSSGEPERREELKENEVAQKEESEERENLAEDEAVFQRIEPDYEPVEVNVYTFNFDEVEEDEDIHLFKQIGKEISFGSQMNISYQGVKRKSNYIVIPLTNDQNEEVYIFPKAVYIKDEDNRGREIKNLPNAVIKKRYVVERVFESKTKVLLSLVEKREQTEHLFLVNKVTGELESRKF
ncbi:hypothetical protein [Parvicella tangerina]|uniref:Uncharacterized protein n=1 Tax=Parvicella tangerina TaxID=2829795 RepID=A0A916JK77_9FLAO|nr:hypothetical protein [Parvicella tangerina]CAG5077176.1 hypothetical protein CRYO30217_00311 [Parvicella tangerina]